MAPSARSKKAAAAAAAPPARPLALVTGGAGFLGRHLVAALLETGRYDVCVLDLRLPEDSARAPGVEYRAGDLRARADVASAVTGAAVVLHAATAAPTGANAYNEALMTAVNVDGTRHVAEACAAAGVQALVYTSSASVVFEGKDLVNIDESQPYAARPMDFYTATKIEGEKVALAANGAGGVATCALRPSGIFGEHDAVQVPAIVRNARAGKLKFIIGSGENLFDLTYAGNVADAHVAAADALLAKGLAAPAAGRAFFITNGDPWRWWGYMGDLAAGLGYARPARRLPFWLVYAIACVVQFVAVPLAALLGRRLETDFTPARVAIVACTRTFSIAAARRDLGYAPRVPMGEALARTVAHFAPTLGAAALEGEGKKKAR
jgi:sterol-4alpha-carboxylate 3-dehydrogenase (decarboxylating)